MGSERGREGGLSEPEERRGEENTVEEEKIEVGEREKRKGR
jgi:hypothetical protein